MEIINTDVLVVGGGSAGARAALEANRAGSDTLLITKGEFGESGASSYQVSDAAGFGAAGFVDPADSAQTHYQDIIRAADGMCFNELANIVATEAPIHLLFLDSIGVPFQQEGDSFLATRSCFSSRARSIKVKGHGKPIVKSLKERAINEGVNVLENSMVINPLLDNSGRCIGALSLLGPGKLIEIRAKATILATGGAGQLFEFSFNPVDVTGDGHVFGLMAGAELINMEFMQSGFGLLTPEGKVGIIQYWLWDLYPELVRANGQTFLKDFIPGNYSIKELMAAKAKHYPFSINDCSGLLETAVQSYINKQKELKDDESVWMSFSGIRDKLAGLPEDHNLKKMWTLSKEFIEDLGVDLNEKFRIACFAHAMNGGLKIDQFGRTTVEGLYAAGEVAGGPHGADRLGGNMFPTGQIFGKRAGLHAALYSRQKETIRDRDVLRKDDSRLTNGQFRGDILANDLRTRLQSLASSSIFIVKTEDRMKNFIHWTEEKLKNLDRLLSDRTDYRDRVELRNLLLLGKLSAISSLQRTESRGNHFREDYPEKSERWNDQLISCSLQDNYEISTRVIESS